MQKMLRQVIAIIMLMLHAGQALWSQEINIIPRPAAVVMGRGHFTLTASTPVIAGPATEAEAGYLAAVLSRAFGEKKRIKAKGKGINLVVDTSLRQQFGNEGYGLQVNPLQVIITAATPAGIFYGIQSLRQLLPAGFEFDAAANKTAVVPVVNITDKPRFPWRAFMLDEARNFQGMASVKLMLNQMALLKMNVFHWHLTDDQGWRIEIKKYPRLTAVGAFRKDTQKSRHSTAFTGDPHNGFYTQEQVREIIQYAQQRHIRVVPEIEMPGHATAAIVAYPWLGTLGSDTQVPDTFGKMKDSYNVADPKVYRFLEDVLTEVFQLFPGKVVHIGGDEVMFDAWKNSPAVQALMKKEKLLSPADVQIFFTNRISHFIDRHGYRMMGWNEIMGGNVHEWQNPEDEKADQKLAQSAIVHFWKGSLELIQKAVAGGYDIVNSYHAQTYLDYDYRTIPLSKAYAFDPVPQGLDAKYEKKILGTGCQLWGEWIQSTTSLQMQAFPRIAAYAEVGWTPKSEKNYTRFLTSLYTLKERWKLEKIVYTESVDGEQAPMQSR